MIRTLPSCDAASSIGVILKLYQCRQLLLIKLANTPPNVLREDEIEKGL
jgi:hypothetical protein